MYAWVSGLPAGSPAGCARRSPGIIGLRKVAWKGYERKVERREREREREK